jgi:hypothetical protein
MEGASTPTLMAAKGGRIKAAKQGVNMKKPARKRRFDDGGMASDPLTARDSRPLGMKRPGKPRGSKPLKARMWASSTPPDGEH